MEIIMYLEKQALKGGGDRYESEDKTLVIYFPQALSRPARLNGASLSTIIMDLKNVEEP